MAPANKGDCVLVRYIGTLDDGTIIEASQEESLEINKKASPPLELIIGNGTRLAELENAIIGMEPDQEKQIRLEPAKAYGTYDPKLVIPARAAQLPPDALPEVGESITYLIQSDEDLAVKITRISTEKVVIDANHPLIEQAINFKITLIDVLPETSN